MKIFVGRQTPEHKGDTSRELIDIWKDLKLCDIIEDEVDDCFIWANNPGHTLLYEYDRWDVYPGLPNRWIKGLFAGQQHPNGTPWIYWGRRPKLLQEKIDSGLKNYEDRQIQSIFLGKIENNIQLNNRTKYDWSKFIELFSMPVKIGDSFNWPYTQEEYLDKVSDSRFGLCLPGYGPKCNREIEYLGLGVVPIITDGVCTRYYDPLIEGMHYFKVKAPEQIEEIISKCSIDRWEYMSYNCRKWYNNNCSPVGSYETTLRIIQ